MPRLWKIAVAVLAVLAFAALLTFPALLRSVFGLRRANRTDEQARRAIVPPISTPTDTPEKAQLFWLSAASSDALEPTAVELDLSADPQERAKQLITALIEKVPSQTQRTLPADTALLQFYLLPNGTAIADFSQTLGTETPSGILNEEMAVDSIVRTLAANLSTIYRLKILIRGLDADTLAGHLDLRANSLQSRLRRPPRKPQPCVGATTGNRAIREQKQTILTFLAALTLCVVVVCGIDIARGNRSTTDLKDTASHLRLHPPRVSVIIPARNEATKIRRALRSVLKQN